MLKCQKNAKKKDQKLQNRIKVIDVRARGARKGGQGGALAPPWKLRCQESFMFKFAN